MRSVLKILCVILVLVSSFAFAATKQKKLVEQKQQQKMVQQLEAVCGQKNHPIRIAGMIGNAPFGWVEAETENQKKLESFGLGRVVFEKIANKLGLMYVSTGFPSQEAAVRALRLGQVDVLLGVYYRDLGRGTKLVYPSYFKNVFMAYFKKGNEIPVSSYRDLAGLKGVVRKEEMIYPLIYQQLPNDVKMQEVWSAATAFEMLMNGEVDYILGSPYALEAELRRHKLQDDIVSGGDVLGEATLFFAFSLNSPCAKLQQKFSQALQEEQFSQKTLAPELQTLIDEWGNMFREDDVLIKTENNSDSLKPAATEN